MKRVVIVRHAKAVPYGYDDDFNRDLRDSGKEDAERLSSELNHRGIVADKMISSPAKRALKTARIFAANLGYEENNIRQNETIYDGLTTSEFLEIINTLPREAKTVFFFGHNPDFHYFVQNLLVKYGEDMPTCATIGIDFDVEQWEKVTARTGKLAFRLIPKMFR